MADSRNASLVVVELLKSLYDSRKCPNARKDGVSSQTIFVIANIGTASTAPGTPHIQYQNTKLRTTATGLIVNRRDINQGVMVSPSIR